VGGEIVVPRPSASASLTGRRPKDKNSETGRTRRKRRRRRGFVVPRPGTTLSHLVKMVDLVKMSLLINIVLCTNYILHCSKEGLYCPEIGVVAGVHILQPKSPRVERGGPEGCNNCKSATKPIKGNKGALQMQFVV
jgi:hypothetical protein